jgi:hypothetical protein
LRSRHDNTVGSATTARLTTALATGTLALLALSGCTAVTTVPIPDETAEAVVEVTEGESHSSDLTTAEWAERALATAISVDEFTTLHGHLDASTSLEATHTDSTLEAGTYSYHFACNGEGDIEFTAGNGDETLFEYEGECHDEDEVGQFVAEESGVTVTASSSGDAIDWAFKLTAPRVDTSAR